MKKQQQLGMNPSTASGKLVKDLLWRFIQQNNQDTCCKCGEKMDRESFSIEHLVPWLDSPNPVEMFFSLDNVAYSHKACNYADARKPWKTGTTRLENKARTERARWERLGTEEQKRIRREKYLKYKK